MADRDIAVCHEALWRWGLTFGGAYAVENRRRQSATGDKRCLDASAILIGSKMQRRFACRRLQGTGNRQINSLADARLPERLRR